MTAMIKGFSKSPKSIGQLVQKGYTPVHQRLSKKVKIPAHKQAGNRINTLQSHKEAKENNL